MNESNIRSDTDIPNNHIQAIDGWHSESFQVISTRNSNRPQNSQEKQAYFPLKSAIITTKQRENQPRKPRKVEHQISFQKTQKRLTKRISNPEDQIESSLLQFQQKSLGDSDFQFSQQLMQNNPKNELRSFRERTKFPHLSIFDWVLKTSSILSISKQAAYRALIIVKKFMFLQQKTPNSRVTLSNVNLYALTALLISSKFQGIEGNFIERITQLTVGEGVKLNREKIIECELYILKILDYKINNQCLIVQSIIKVLHEWNEVVKMSILDQYKFKSSLQILKNSQNNLDNNHQDNDKIWLESFLHLVDFLIARKLVQIKVRDLKSIQNPTIFTKIILTILYHLVLHKISKKSRELKMREMKNFIYACRQIYKRLGIIDIERKEIQRSSHILIKQINRIYAEESEKKQRLRKISEKHHKAAMGYCLCNIQTTSKKYLNLVDDSVYCENTPKGHNLKDKQVELEPIQPTKQPRIPPKIQENDIDAPTIDEQDYSIDQKRASICQQCMKDPRIFQQIIRRQFYLPISGRKAI